MASAPDKDGVTPPPKWLFRLPQSYLGFQPHLRGAQGLHSGHVGLVPPLPQGSAAGECHGQREAPGGPHGGNRSTCSDVKGSGALTCARAPGRRCPAHLGARAQLRHVTPCQPCARLPAGCRRTDPALRLHRSVLPRTLWGWGLLAHDLGRVGHSSPHGESTAEEQPTLSGRCGSRVHPPGPPPPAPRGQPRPSRCVYCDAQSCRGHGRAGACVAPSLRVSGYVRGPALPGPRGQCVFGPEGSGRTFLQGPSRLASSRVADSGRAPGAGCAEAAREAGRGALAGALAAVVRSWRMSTTVSGPYVPPASPLQWNVCSCRRPLLNLVTWRFFSC